MNEDKELIWISKELAEEYKRLDTDIEKSNMVNEIIRKKRIDINDDLEYLEEDLIRFKGFALSYASKFQEAYKEQGLKIEKIWDDCQEPIEKVRAETNKVKKEIGGILDVVKNISHSLENLDTYKLESIIKIIDKYNMMTDEDKEIFSLILNNR